MKRESFVALFLVAMLGFGLLAAGCPQSGGGGGGSDGGTSGLVCNNGCYCPTGCGQLYKCDNPGQCVDTFCCCTGGGCGRCGCS